HTGENLEKGALAGAIAADDADDLAVPDRKRDVLQRPERRLFLDLATASPHRPFGERNRRVNDLRDRVAKRPVTLAPAKVVLLRQPIGVNRERHGQMTSTNPRSMRRK